jgi:hypothetical protein
MKRYSKEFINNLEELLSDVTTVHELDDARLVMFSFADGRELHFYDSGKYKNYIVLENNKKEV